MVSSSERRKLLKSMNGEPAGAWFILAKCAAGLAVTVLIAVIGASERGDRETGSEVAVVVPPTAQPAQVHRKQVFDERRARFSGGADQRSVAGVAVRPSNRLSTVLQ